VSAFDLVAATFPAGTLSGAPKPMAMTIIEELEKTKRGVYGGCVGYFDFAGNIDTAIAIRSTVIKDSIAYVQAGAGVVAGGGAGTGAGSERGAGGDGGNSCGDSASDADVGVVLVPVVLV
jgi:hypothetical protein